MAQPDVAPARQVFADTWAPTLDPREVADLRSQVPESFPADMVPPLGHALEQQAHVGEHRVSARAVGLGIDVGPEPRRLHAKLGKDRVVLHRLGREGAVEVVDDGDRVEAALHDL